jgi:hypothetical protein
VSGKRAKAQGISGKQETDRPTHNCKEEAPPHNGKEEAPPAKKLRVPYGIGTKIRRWFVATTGPPTLESISGLNRTGWFDGEVTQVSKQGYHCVFNKQYCIATRLQIKTWSGFYNHSKQKMENSTANVPVRVPLPPTTNNTNNAKAQEVELAVKGTSTHLTTPCYVNPS